MTGNTVARHKINQHEQSPVHWLRPRGLHVVVGGHTIILGRTRKLAESRRVKKGVGMLSKTLGRFPSVHAHRTRLQCVHVDPTGPVFWPRLTRTLGSCSPRSHPSSHALFHPGETIVRRRVYPVPSAVTRDRCFVARWRAVRCEQRSTSTTDGNVSHCDARTRASHAAANRSPVGQKLSGAAPRDVGRACCTVAPRRGSAGKPAAGTQGWPPPPSNRPAPLPATATRTC